MPWSFSVFANRFQVPPYRSVELTMLSPTRARFWIEQADAGLAGGDRERRHPTVERGDAFLQHIAGRVS